MKRPLARLIGIFRNAKKTCDFGYFGMGFAVPAGTGEQTLPCREQQG